MKTMIVSLFSVLISANFAHAHGEDRPGPHKGFIRMPGAFHTEVVKTSSNVIKVYLLTLDWKSPTVKNSKVEARLKNAKNSEAQCVTKTDYFLCTFDRKINLDAKDELLIQSTREGQVGNIATYPLPLTLEPVIDHSKHQM